MFESDYEEIQAALNWIISFSTFVMITALLGCVCGCKKDRDKEEWLGKEGKVKQLSATEDDRLLRQHGDNKAIANVANRASTANRSLPDIPKNESRDSEPPWDNNQLTTTSDNCSELYATVGDAPNPDLASDSSKPSKKRQAPSAPSTENSQSEATPPNSKISHQYAKLSHPYARVKPPPPKTDVPHHASSSTVTQPSIELESSETTPGVQGGSETTLSSSTDQPVPPPRARRSSSQSNLYLPHSNSPSRPSSGRRSNNTLPSSSSSSSSRMSDTIAAAPAICGQISASQELPYITLPIVDNSIRHNSVPSDLPTRSNGCEGSNMMGLPDSRCANGSDEVDQGGAGAQTNFSGDSQDSSKGYTSISVREPLASIRAQTSQAARRMDPHYATVSDDSDEMYAAIEERSGSETYAQIVPPPPSVDSLRSRVAENHSRQASSSSAASSVANVGSPKPEKRQANSPLPPPPLAPPPNSTPPSTPTPAPPLSLEDMYAKVVKKKSSNSSVENTPTHKPTPQPPPPPQQPPPIVPTATPEPDLSEMELNLNTNPGYESLNSNILPPINTLAEPNYESVTSTINSDLNNPGYAVVQNSSSVKTTSTITSNISSNNSDPGYELVRNTVLRNPSQRSNIDPNYEELRDKNAIIEPNYELLNGVDDTNEPNYEPLTNTSSSDDPNYESVGGFNEPPYEQLSGELSSPASNSDILYATVNKSNKKVTK